LVVVGRRAAQAGTAQPVAVAVVGVARGGGPVLWSLTLA
jgi:hypothetical protein